MIALALLNIIASVVGMPLPDVPRARIEEFLRKPVLTVFSRSEFTSGIAEYDDVVLTVFSPSMDNTAGVWFGERIKLEGHRRNVMSATFSPDGSKIVTASCDRTVRVWFGERFQKSITLERHEARVNSATFSPDGSKIVSTSDDSTVRVWFGERFQKSIILIGGHRGYVRCATFSPDGSKILSTGADGTVRVWFGVSRVAVSMMPSEHSLGTLPDFEVLTACDWSITLDDGLPDFDSATFSPDGSKIVSESGTTYSKSRYLTVRVWFGDQFDQSINLKGHGNRVRSATFSPDGSKIVSASDDNTVRVWFGQRFQESITLEGHSHDVNSATFSPDGSKIVSTSDDSTVRVWFGESFQKCITLVGGHRGYVRCATFSHDGSKILSKGADDTVRVWFGVSRFAVSDVLTAYGWSITLDDGNSFDSATFSPDGSKIVSVSIDMTIRVWFGERFQESITLEGHRDRIFSATFSPDGSKIVSASDDNILRVWFGERFQEYKIFSVPVNPTVRLLSEQHDFDPIEGRMRIFKGALPSKDFGIPKMISRLLDQWIPNSSDTA